MAAVPPPSELSDTINPVGPELKASSTAQPLEQIGPGNEPREMPLAETAPATGPFSHLPPSRPTALSTSASLSTPAGLKQPETVPAARSGDATAVDSVHSERIEQIARQADEQIRHGFELANRGAYYAARASFLGALRLVAEGLDTEQKSNHHGHALAAALTAIQEADDFLTGGARIETPVELHRIVATHTTPVLKKNKTDEVLTSMMATQRYFTFAQEQFSDAAGREVAGSMALYALGKLHNALAQKKSSLEVAAESKAIVYYQAALLSYPKNHMAANDLGALLARYGRYQEARSMLEYSLACQPLSVTWHNLSVVYQHIRQPSLAQNASQQAVALEQVEAARRRAAVGSANGTVRWLDSQAFAATGMNSPTSPYAYSRPPVQAARPSAEPGRLPTDARTATALGSAASGPRPETRPTLRHASSPSSAERMSWGAGVYQR